VYGRELDRFNQDLQRYIVEATLSQEELMKNEYCILQRTHAGRAFVNTICIDTITLPNGDLLNSSRFHPMDDKYRATGAGLTASERNVNALADKLGKALCGGLVNMK
jgi:hypothetical protein